MRFFGHQLKGSSKEGEEMLAGLTLSRGIVGLQIWIHFSGATENPSPQICNFCYLIIHYFEVRELKICDL